MWLSCVTVLLIYVGTCSTLQQRRDRQQHTSSLCSSRSRCDFHTNDVEQRLLLFWEGRPFHVAERVTRNVLTSGNPTSRLLLPLSFCINDDNGFFSRCYSGNFSYMVEGLEKSISVPNKKKKQSFCLFLAYAGQFYCGWQRQPDNPLLPSVQEVVECAIQSAFIENGRADVRVSGRTDAGVSALGQVARVRISTRNGPNKSFLTASQVLNVLDVAARFSNYTWRCLYVSEVSDSFHPTFHSTSRSYIYALDANALSELCMTLVSTDIPNMGDLLRPQLLNNLVIILNSLLVTVEGKELDYIAFSYGKVKTETTLCALQHAKVRLCKEVLSSVSEEEKEPETVMIFEFTGDRFLRRMVRMLVGTSIYVALQILLVATSKSTMPSSSHPDSQVLLELCNSRKRNSSLVKTAPPGGLIFIGAKCLEGPTITVR